MKRRPPDSHEPSKAFENAPRFRAFLRQAAAIIATTRGMNAESHAKLQSLSNHLGLSDDEYATAISRLDEQADQQPPLNHYEKRFVEFFESELAKLKGDILPRSTERKAIALAKRRFDIAPNRAEQLLNRQCEASGVSRVAPEEAIVFARRAVSQLVQARSSIDEATRNDLAKVARAWGLEEAFVEQLAQQLLAERRSQRRAARFRRLVSLAIGLLVVGAIGGGAAYFSGLLDLGSRSSLLNDGEHDLAIELGSESNSNNERSSASFLPPATHRIITQLCTVDSQLAAAFASQPLTASATAEDNQRAATALVDAYCDTNRAADSAWHQSLSQVIGQIYYTAPDFALSTVILQATLSRLNTELDSSALTPTLSQFSDDYMASELLGKLYYLPVDFSIETPERFTRQSAIADEIEPRFRIAFAVLNSFEDYQVTASRSIALAQWNDFAKMSFVHPRIAAQMLGEFESLAGPPLEPELLSLLREETTLTLMQQAPQHWPAIETQIVKSLGDCDEPRLLSWIKLYQGLLKSNEDSRLSELLGKKISLRIRDLLRNSAAVLGPLTELSLEAEDFVDVELPEVKMAERIERYATYVRNRPWQPLLRLDSQLETQAQQVIGRINGDDSDLPEQIANVSRLVNLELDFCHAVEQAKQLGTSVDEDDQLKKLAASLEQPWLDLRLAVRLPEEELGRAETPTETATASDFRRLQDSLERLGNLSREDAGRRVLAINQLEAISPRITRLNYDQAAIIAKYFLADIELREILNVERQIASFRRWPNLALAIADQLEDANVELDQAVTVARLLVNRDFEISQAVTWKAALREQILSTVADRLDTRARAESNDWWRLERFLEAAYRSRAESLAKANGRAISSESDDASAQQWAQQVFVAASSENERRPRSELTPSGLSRPIASSRWSELVRAASRNELDRIAKFNQLLAGAWQTELESESRLNESAAASIRQARISLAAASSSPASSGQRLLSSELLLLRVIDERRQHLIAGLVPGGSP